MTEWLHFFTICRVIFHVVAKGCFLWTVHSLGKTLLTCFICYSKAKLACYSKYILTSLFCIPVVCVCVCVCVLVLEGVVGLRRIDHLHFFDICDCGIDLDYCDVECFALETKWHRSVIVEFACKYYILDSVVDPEGYSISSEGFLPTVVCRVVIWIIHTFPPILVHWPLKCRCSLLPSPAWPCSIYLIHGPNSPGSYAILFVTASHFTFSTRPIHNWALFLLCPATSLFLELVVITLCSSPVAYWTDSNLMDSSFTVISFAFLYCSWGSWRKDTGVSRHSLLLWTMCC